jgi:protein SCO1/2
MSFRALVLALAGGLWLVGSALAEDRAAPKTPALPDLPIRFGGPFALTDHHGEPRTDRDFRGRFMLIQFGYTFCPDICPISLDTMSTALDLLGAAAEQVQPIFISVDPERDTPAALAEYVEHFHPRLLAMTGTEQAVRAVAKAYRVHRHKVVPDGTDPADYLVDHGSITYLMGPDGCFVTLFPYATTAEVMAEAIGRHLDAGS